MAGMTPAMFRKLTVLGLSQDQMAGVLEVFNEVEAADEHRRAMQRERWHRGRGKKALTLDKRELTLANDSRAPAPAEGSSSKKELTEQKKVRERSPNGSRLPKDFVPKLGIAKDAGLTREEFDVEIAKFKDHWTAKAGKDARKADWQATWRNWCRRAVEYRKGRAREPTYAEQSMEDFKSVWENGHGTEEKQLGDGDRRNVVRLLPRKGGEPDRDD